MLYATQEGGVSLVVLETENLDYLRQGQGHSIRTPDGKIVITWTPAPGWLAAEFLKTDGDAEQIAKLVRQSHDRSQEPLREPHEPVLKPFRAPETP